MRLTLRAKLIAICGTAAAGFLLLLVTNVVLSARIQRELERIEAEYVPLLELGPALQSALDDSARAFQDAVAAQDRDQLGRATEARDRFLAEIDEHREVEARNAVALRAAMIAYHDAALGVSERMIAGETGEHVVDAISTMQARQKKVSALVKQNATLDRRQLEGAFERAMAAQSAAFRIRLVVIVVCLAAVTWLSVWLARDVLRSVESLSAGLERFGAGRLDEPIQAHGDDELAALARHANRMAESLRHSVSELEAFNYSVSHDLRAPLRPLDGFSQALIEDYADRLDEKGVDYLKRIRAAAQRMSQLIEDMLQLSRLARTEIVKRTCDLVPIVEAISAELRRTEPARDVEWVVPARLRVNGDPRLLRIVLENLVRNAWKFSRDASHARIELGSREEPGETVCFLRDNGDGFDPEQAHKLFQPFQRLHAGTRFEGTGIGLAIVQRIVRRHGGRVWAESEPGRGATFYFTLPRDEALPDVARPEGSTIKEGQVST